ncbi:MAG: T9SS type A sorting domain-containing protein [Flavobacteriales bacterium]
MRNLLTHLFLAAAFSTSWIGVQAQLPSSVDISLEHDAGNQALLVSLRANDNPFDGVVSLVFTIRWPESSAATLGIGSSPWCPAPSVAFPVAPTSMVTPGTGYKYRTWTVVGLALLGAIEDDGGCEQSLLADEWTVVYSIPINNDPGGTAFEVSEDAWTEDNNRSYFISGAGVNVTGAVISGSTESTVIEASGGSTLVLQPNPAANDLMVSGSGMNGAWRTEVLDAAGRVALGASGAQWPIRLDVSTLPNGAYTLVVSGSQSIHTTPLLIAR